MSTPTRLESLAALLACAALAACAGPQPKAYTGLASASYLKPNTQDRSGKIPLRYTTEVDWSHYNAAILDPVEIYQGGDQQFGTLSDTERQELARYMQAAFTQALAKRFTLTSTPGPDTLRIKLTLTGAAGTPFIGKFAHLDMGGNVYNLVQAARGGQGLSSGWVMYAAEVTASDDGHLLEAFETKQYPGAMNVKAAFGTMAAAKIALDQGAADLTRTLR